MSMRAGSTPKSQRASITSSPLFMSVAESIVIFAPIDQFGCLSARSGVTPGSSAAGTVRSGPPEAVRIRRRTSLAVVADQRLVDGAVLASRPAG